MTLRGIPSWPRSRYDSKINNIATEFFIPALRESTTYRRIAGFFSSTSLSLAARGIMELIYNDGKMQLVISPILTKEDAFILNNDRTRWSEIINTSLTNKLDMPTEFEKNHIAALAYLLKKGFLEIKVDIPTDMDGNCLDYDSIMEKNIQDEKLGIFQDRDGNAVSFRGPVNENRQSWEMGVFSITVDTDWVEGQKPHVEDDVDRFQKIWQEPSTLVLPQKTREHLLLVAPDTASDIDLDKFNVPQWAVLPNGHVLWDHQIRAVNSWMNYDYKGILSLATSGGKTLAALVGASLLPNDSIVLILVPTKVLVDQWEKEIRKFQPAADLVLCDGDHPNWNTILSGKTGTYITERPNRDRHLLVLSTMKTASSKKFMRNFEHIPARFITVISDEVHHLGAPTYSRIFEINAKQKLGLSATFVRDWDEIGTNKIREYFGRELDVEYTVTDGIREQKLSRYEYLPFFAYLNESEYAEYTDYSASIRQVYAQLKHMKDNTSKSRLEKKYNRLVMKRAVIIKKAKDKPRAYGRILLSSPKKPYIVFADDNDHIDVLKKVHKDTIRKINLQRSNDLEKDDIMTFSGKLSPDEREKIMEETKNNQTPMFAMYCLDEGIDVPEFQSAILVSSSTSKREYIQRRGRILRTSGKKVAYLYDVIVLPNPHSYVVDQKDADAIIEHEKVRIHKLAADAINKWDAINTFERKLRDLGY